MPNNSGLYGSAGNAPLVPANDTTSLYGASSGAQVPDSNGNFLVKGDLAVNGGNITTTAATATVFNTNAQTLSIGGAATQLNLGAGSGTTSIGNNLAVGLGLTVYGNEILNGTLTTSGTGTFNSNVVVNGPLQVNNAGTFTGLLTAPDATFGNIQIAPGGNNNLITTSSGDLQLQPTTGNLVVKPATNIQWAENSLRTNRLNFQSTNGTTSGIRVQPPVTTGGIATSSVNTTNDLNNTQFVNISASQAATNPLRVQTGKYTSGVLGPSGTSLAFVDNVTTYATVNPAGPTIGSDLTTKTYVDAQIATRPTYSINASTIAGGANINLAGSDSSVSTVELVSGTGITVAETDNHHISITNSGVTSLIPGLHMAVSGSTGAVTFNSDATPVNINNSIVSRNSAGGFAAGNIVATSIGTNQISYGGWQWFFNNDGTTSFPNYKFTVNAGSNGQVLTNDGAGNVNWTTPTTVTNHLTNGSYTLTLNSDGTVQFPDYKFSNTVGTSGQVLSSDGAGNVVWATLPSDIDNQLVNGSYTLSLNNDGTVSFPTYKFPYADGSNGQVLVADGVGNLNWSAPPAGSSLVNGSYTFNLNADGSLSTPGTTVLKCDDIAGADSRLTLNGNQSILTASHTGVGTAPSATVTTDGGSGVTTINSSDGITSTNYNWTFNADGTATFPASGASGNPARVQTTSSNFQVNANGGIFDFNSGGTLATPYFTLPGSIGTSGQVLAVPGSGSTLVWTTPTTGTITSVTGGGHITANTVSGAVTLGSDATSSNTASTIVARDASGNFSAGTITASLSGNATTATTANKVANALTIGTHLTGGSFDGSSAVTIATDATSANTASTIIARDSNSNFAFNNTQPGYTTTATAGGTTTLTVASTYHQRFTGSSAQTVKLPDATTMAKGQGFIIDNDSTGNLSIQDGSGGSLGTVVPGAAGYVFNENNATTAGSWSGYLFVPGAGPSGQITWGTAGLNMGGSYITDVQGIQATTNSAYSFPNPSFTTISNNNGYDGASSFLGTVSGNNAGGSYIQYFADTLAGTNTAAVQGFKAANGNSVAGSTVPFTGATSVAPSAVVNTSILGTTNFNGYATTGFTDAISGMGQGGGLSSVSALQIQGVASETFADGTLTISGATITAVTRTSVAFASVSVTGTKGQISFTSTTPAVGNAVVVTGTNSGTSTGITAGTYYIIVTNGSTTATLSATPGGAPITTTAGTTTGLTFTRQFITLTYSAQSNIPFGVNALIAVSGITNVTNGTYMAMGTSTTTTVNIGAPSSGTPALSGTQSLSVSTVTNGGAFLRVRAMPPATTFNSGNRVELINHSTTAATYRADTFNISAGAYGATGANYVTIGATGGTYTGTGIVGTFIRQDTSNTDNPALLLRHQRTDTSGPNDGDGVDFRLGVGGTSTTANTGRVDSVYKSSTLHEVGMSTSTDSFATNTTRIFIGTADTTKIQATPSGSPTGTLQTVATFTQASTTVAVAGVNKLTVDANKVTAAVPVAFPVYTASAANAITGSVGWQISISNSPTAGGRMAYWDTTNARWSYISDNTAV